MKSFDNKCFDKTLRESKDIKVYYQHDETKPIARTKNGTLRLENTDTELRFSFDVPETTDGNDLLTLVRDGIIDSCSFGMIVIRDKYEIDNSEEVRTVLEARLLEISPVTNPAYLDTKVYCRSLSEALKDKENLDETDIASVKEEIEQLKSLLPQDKSNPDESDNKTANPDDTHPEPEQKDNVEETNEPSPEEQKHLEELMDRLNKAEEIINEHRRIQYGH